MLKESRAIVIIAKRPKEDTLLYYENNFPTEKLICVSPELNEFNLINKFEFREDDSFLDRKSFFKSYNIARKGWYYQQFLKYEIILQLPYNHVHIIDGDSLLSPTLLFNHNVRKTPIKLNIGYNNFFSKANKDFIKITRENFITNEMSFKRKELLSMLADLGVNGDNYIETFISWISLDSWFSEYQLYALYKRDVIKVTTSNMKVFRRFDLIPSFLKKIYHWNRRYDLVAYEWHHKSGSIRTARAIVYYIISKNLG